MLYYILKIIIRDYNAYIHDIKWSLRSKFLISFGSTGFVCTWFIPFLKHFIIFYGQLSPVMALIIGYSILFFNKNCLIYKHVSCPFINGMFSSIYIKLNDVLIKLCSLTSYIIIFSAFSPETASTHILSTSKPQICSRIILMALLLKLWSSTIRIFLFCEFWILSMLKLSRTVIEFLLLFFISF